MRRFFAMCGVLVPLTILSAAHGQCTGPGCGLGSGYYPTLWRQGVPPGFTPTTWGQGMPWGYTPTTWTPGHFAGPGCGWQGAPGTIIAPGTLPGPRPEPLPTPRPADPEAPAKP